MVKESTFIDLNKGATVIFFLVMLTVYDRWSNTTAVIYTAIHGAYGILWVTKGFFFPDAAFVRECSLFWGIVVVLGSLSTYWSAGAIIIIRNLEAPNWLILAVLLTYTIGIFIHYTSDMMKHERLKWKRGLITDGLFASSRNINYFGELLIYGSFAALSMHWFPVLYLALFVGAYWIPRMLAKDKSLAKYPEFAEYKKRSALFIPYLF
jgi:steroid 5-alpha reductase family enzyme